MTADIAVDRTDVEAGTAADAVEGLAERRAEDAAAPVVEHDDVKLLRPVHLAGLAQERSENEARRTTVVTAPYAATITGIVAHAGQVIGAGGLLATLIPDGASLEAQLFASTRQAGFVARGQKVRLRYAAYPYQKFGMGEGVVETIEKSPYAPQELPTQVIATLGAGALQGAEPVYRVVVKLDAQTIDTYGQSQPLKSGMVFDADVIQDTRRLYEWLLEPVYGLRGR